MTHTDNKSLVEAVKNAWTTLWVEDGQHDRCLPPNPYVVLLQDLLPEQSICKLAEAAIAALQNQPQVDNNSLVELLNKLEQEAFNFGFARATGRYWHHHADNVDKYKAAIAALQNQLQMDNKSLVKEALLKCCHPSFINGENGEREYSFFESQLDFVVETVLSALQNQQPSVNQEILEALSQLEALNYELGFADSETKKGLWTTSIEKLFKERESKRADIKQALSNAESSKPKEGNS